MPQYVSLDNLKFTLFEYLDVETLCSLERYSEYDKEHFQLLLSSIKDFSDQEIYPSFFEMDSAPAHYSEGSVVVHKSVERIMRFAGESGFIGATFDYDHGGMQLPYTIHAAMSHIIQCANNHLPGYVGLTGGSAHLVISYGSEDLIEKYTPKMLSGEWGGTMCLTEPQAGSSLSDIKTSARKNDDGSYGIKGQKIFISGGDHQYCDNFVHLVLARIEGAPQGTKGISLFVVPKFRILEDGSLEPNDVITAGDFQKMGQKGYCTTHLVFGENEDCKGWLVGNEHKGLRYMFKMMNGARIDVGLTACSISSAAYYASLQYAKERPQGRRINDGVKDYSKEPTLIINHPDVRRMLLLQRAVSEGSLSLLLQATKYQDLAEYGPEDKREYYHDLLEILTPIAKTYPSEMGRTSVSNGLQVLGGYGFCTDFPLQQYYRDIRIMALYEGTTGIQSLDLLGRKLILKNGALVKNLMLEINQVIESALAHEELRPYGQELKAATELVGNTIGHLVNFAMNNEHERFISDATIFMQMMGQVIIAWQWLAMSVRSKEILNLENRLLKQDFYKNKIFTMRYFYKYELSKIESLHKIITHSESLVRERDGSNVFE